MKLRTFLFILSVFFIGACSKNILPVYSVKSINNWPEDSKPGNLDSVSNVYFEMQRDEQNLYLHIKTSELATQMKILRHGLSIYFDPNEGKSELIGFTFPVALTDSLARRFGGRGEGRGDSRGDNERGDKQNGPPTQEQLQRRMLQRIYKNYSERPKEMLIKGFSGDKKTIILGKDPSDIQVDLELGNDNTLNYYAVIPIKKINEQSKKGKGRFSVGIVSGYLIMDENSGQRMGGFGGGGGQGNSQMSEEDRAKRLEFMMKMTEKMTKPLEIWFVPEIR